LNTAVPDQPVTPLRIERLDPLDTRHAWALLTVLDGYARDPSGGGTGLTDEVKARLPGLLAQQTHYIGLLAFEGDRPVGLINAFLGVSTFKAKPLLNIHDIAVEPDRRGAGVGRRLLAAAEELARERACCKLTLEVLEGNHTAVGLYRAVGFAAYELDPAMGAARFFEKWLT
jgi:ribosomal protein S18 acetylase RimI-like enzyme